jgi:hypothetical protein
LDLLLGLRVEFDPVLVIDDGLFSLTKYLLHLGKFVFSLVEEALMEVLLKLFRFY